MPKQAKAKRDGVINQKKKKLQFKSILIQTILMLSKRYESTEVDRTTFLVLVKLSNKKYDRNITIVNFYYGTSIKCRIQNNRCAVAVATIT